VKYAVDKGSAAVIHIPGLIKIASAIRKFLGGIYMHNGDRMSLGKQATDQARNIC
jgi:hypothetical protein